MALTHQNSWEAVNHLHRQINRLFDLGESGPVSSSATADWVPPADIAEYGDRFVLKFDVPGVDLSSIDIVLDRGVLAVSGTRADEVEAKGAERGRTERPRGRFHRRFTLPDTVDAGNVAASGRNGVLEVTIPKQPKAQPRRIQVANA
jgi:HSP20 family protein